MEHPIPSQINSKKRGNKKDRKNKEKNETNPLPCPYKDG